MSSGEFDHDQFARVLAYYRDCIAHDADRSVALQTNDEGQKFLPLQLTSEWTLSGLGDLSVELAGKNARFASELSQRSSSAEVMYGYPILAKRNRTGQLEFVPVFLQPVEHELNENTLTARLIHEWPDVNEAFRRSIGVVTREETAQLYEQLGITAEAELPPEGLSYFVRRLAKLLQLPKGETLDPNCIPNEPRISEIKAEGILNRHILVITDRPRFTAGLERELSSLSKGSRSDRVDGTALKYFFGVVPRSGAADQTDNEPNNSITEVVPLNDEQRSAVQSAFRDDLTVVTGPPGTGKSQIVTNVVANAWIRGQSVLFASYNNKAVDVVEDRVNRLSSRPLMIRTGRRAGDRDLRGEIVAFMSNVLSSDVSDHDRLELDEAHRIVGMLEKDRESIWRALEDVRVGRNRVYQLDKEVLGIKSELESLDGRFVEARQLREQDEIRLNNKLGELREYVDQLKRERDVARSTRDRETAAINLEIEGLLTAVELLHEREEWRVEIDNSRLDADFISDMTRKHNELDSLQQQRELDTRTRDARIMSLKRRRDRLDENFDLQRWNRQKDQDITALGKLILNTLNVLTAEIDRNGSLWWRIWKGWRRDARFKRIAGLTEAWAEEYDILGQPPSSPIVADGLEFWTAYLSDALTRLSEWEQDAKRNCQLVKEIDGLDKEIAQVEAEFDEKEFDLRETRLKQSLFERVQAQIASLNKHIDDCRDQIQKVNDDFECKKFEERIADKHREIDRLSSEHESKHGAKFAELNALQRDGRRCLEDSSSKFNDLAADLAKMHQVNDLAKELKHAEKQIWDAGNRLIDASVRVLPDRFDAGTRRSIGDFRALFKRLLNDRLGGAAYGRLMREMEALFPKVMAALPAWCVTNLSARGNIPLHAGMFDLVIIDEASQCNIPSALPLLYRAKRAMIIGDPNQLRHITTIDRSRDQKLQVQHGLESASDQSFSFSQQSLFDTAVRNTGKKSLHSLREHFRSHADIIEFSNRHWYNDRLLVCTDYNELQIPTGEQAGIRWCDVNGRVERSSRYNGNINEAEAQVLSKSIVDLIAARGFHGSVGVVAPFRAQANLIRSILNRHLNPSDVERCELITDTAHAFQGDEKDVVFFSPCVECQMPSGAEWFISGTDNLFNVAITRPRALLVVVGNLEACLASKIPHVKDFAEFYNNTLQGKDSAIISPGFVDGPTVGHWERPFYDALIGAGLKPMHQYVEGQYRLDFAFVTDNMKLNVEVDGEMYHREWDGSRSRDDLMRDHRLMGMGWQIKRFWVYELRDDMERCVDEVNALVG